MHTKLFIPGPIEVKKELLEAQTKPMVGHRSKEYSELHGSVVSKFRKFMNLDRHEVFLFASSATGVMEAAVRNCAKGKILHTICGAFSKRWQDISEANEKELGTLEVEWGSAIKPEALEEELEKNEYQAVAITHNETSTGVMNPLKDLIDVIKTSLKDDSRDPSTRPDKSGLAQDDSVNKDSHPLIFIDAVSSFAGTVIKPEELGIDILIFGTQKCMGLPPGLAFAVVSPRAMEVSQDMPNKGYYFDFHVMKKYQDKNSQTPATPAISLLNALDKQLDNLLEEGMEARAERHKEMAKMSRDWCAENGFDMLPEKGYESDTMTAAENTPDIDIKEFRSSLQEQGYQIADAYGKLKGTGFRIGHMGDWEVDELRGLLETMDRVLKGMEK